LWRARAAPLATGGVCRGKGFLRRQAGKVRDGIVTGWRRRAFFGAAPAPALAGARARPCHSPLSRRSLGVGGREWQGHARLQNLSFVRRAPETIRPEDSAWRNAWFVRVRKRNAQLIHKSRLTPDRSQVDTSRRATSASLECRKTRSGNIQKDRNLSIEGSSTT